MEIEISVINKETISDLLHRFTMEFSSLALHALRNNLSTEEKSQLPMPIIPDEPNSPVICALKNHTDQFIIFYPKHSPPYPFKLDGLIKECTILMGEVHEKRSRVVYREGDEFIIPPNEVYEPYTKDHMALAHVIVRDPKHYT